MSDSEQARGTPACDGKNRGANFAHRCRKIVHRCRKIVHKKNVLFWSPPTMTFQRRAGPYGAKVACVHEMAFFMHEIASAPPPGRRVKFAHARIKNEAERRRALVKHRDARAGERHQLVGHQMNEQVRHRAVQALEGEPGKVARAGADTTQRHLGHALGGKAGNEAVAQVAHAADVDVARRVVVSTKWKCSKAPFIGL